MNPSHHPSADVLVAYASGLLEPGFGLVVGAHVEMCAACRANVRNFEAASGDALSLAPEAEVAADAIARVMARLDQKDELAPIVDRRSILQRLPLKQRKWIAPGVWVAAVDTPHAPENRLYLLSVAPGMPTARHEHSGAEFCTVLHGAFRDYSGLYAAGDFAAADETVNHLPVVEGDEDCICLFATEGRLKPQGLLGRLAFAYADV